MVAHHNGHRAAPPDYRTLMSCFPSGVAVVSTFDTDGRPHGMTCTSLCSVSVDPPTLLVSLHLRSGTYQALRDSGWFGLNLLHARSQPVAELFASAVPDRYGRVNWRPSPVVGVPWLVDDAFAIAECRVGDTIRASDHVVVLAEVVNIHQTSDVPLLYGLRQFSAWPGAAARSGEAVSARATDLPVGPGATSHTGRDDA